MYEKLDADSAEQKQLHATHYAGSRLKYVDRYRLQWHAFEDRRCGWTLQHTGLQFEGGDGGYIGQNWEILYIAWAPPDHGFIDDSPMYQVPPSILPLSGWQV